MNRWKTQKGAIWRCFFLTEVVFIDVLPPGPRCRSES